MRKIAAFIILLLCSSVYSQQNDSITLSKKELQELIQEEVQKEIDTRTKQEKDKQSELKEVIRNEIQNEINTRLAEEKEIQNTNNKSLLEQLSILKGRLKFGGKSLIRFAEWDFDQNKINPKTGERSDVHTRFWTRFNFYLNMEAAISKNLNLYAQIRTGHKQYSFVTFGENTDERFSIMLDEFWVHWNKNNYDLILGRQNASRIWTNQQGIQFDIPRHDGITAMAKYKLGTLTVTPKLAFFIEHYKNDASYKKQGKVYGGAVMIEQTKKDYEWKAETGLIQANQLPVRYVNDLVQKNSEINYLDGDMAPDYSIWTSHFSFSLPQIKNLTIALDYYNNLKDYKTNPKSTNIHDDKGNSSINNPHLFNPEKSPNFTKQTQGFIGTISIGNTTLPKNLFFGISYLYLEKYAAMDYFAQYDFARWASTNLKGPEFTVAYRLNKFLELKSKLFLTKEIKGLEGIDSGYKRSGNRFRIDMNIKF